jgi:YebC/PmpR family DNA-binding regulatory protein
MGRHGTIAGRKAAQDSKRAAVFTKYARLITVAAKAGGDPDYNPGLRQAIDKAKGIGMPNDNIKRAIQKGTGELGGETYEECTFEGYGAGGVAVVVECLSDNKNRVTSAVKHDFDKFGGNFGVPGCVSYMFNKKGVIVIEKTDGLEEDEVMMAALDAGAEDVIPYDDSFEVQCDPEVYDDVDKALREAGYEIVESDIEQVPNVTSTPTDEAAIKNLKKMIASLEDNDDVQKVYTNCTLDLYED